MANAMLKTYFLIGSDDQIHELPADRNILIGRGPINWLVLNDRLVSRVHASITPSPKGPVFTDRGSANGSQVNGLPVQETILNHGDTIRIGKFLFHVFCGTREEADQWLHRRKSGTKTEQTITDLNVTQLRPTDVLGDLSAFNIIVLLQTLMDQKRNGTLTLALAGQALGKICFANGTIVYAETAAGVKGKEAFYELAVTPKGQFTFRVDDRAPALLIMDNPTALILEACKRFDDQQANAGHAGSTPHPFGQPPR
jgi:hypothetical protein